MPLLQTICMSPDILNHTIDCDVAILWRQGWFGIRKLFHPNPENTESAYLSRFQELLAPLSFDAPLYMPMRAADRKSLFPEDHQPNQKTFSMPELLLLDEPVNGLDFQSTEFLYEQMAGYREHGTLLFSSHILESITLTSDRVVVLENGRIRQTYEGGQVDATVLREALRDETNDV